MLRLVALSQIQCVPVKGSGGHAQFRQGVCVCATPVTDARVFVCVCVSGRGRMGVAGGIVCALVQCPPKVLEQ